MLENGFSNYSLIANVFRWVGLGHQKMDGGGLEDRKMNYFFGSGVKLHMHLWRGGKKLGSSATQLGEQSQDSIGTEMHMLFVMRHKFRMEKGVTVREIMEMSRELLQLVLQLDDGQDSGDPRKEGKKSRNEGMELIHKTEELVKATGIPLGRFFWAKLELNKAKYPARICQEQKGGIRKYTEHCDVTGISKEANDNMVLLSKDEFVVSGGDDSIVNYSEAKKALESFAKERGWDDGEYQCPKIQSYLISEVGELNGILCRQELCCKIEDMRMEDRQKIGSEITDVFIFVMHHMRVRGM